MKKNLISSILSLVMTSLLLIGVVVAWYTSNKEVSSKSIVGQTERDTTHYELYFWNSSENSWIVVTEINKKNVLPGTTTYFKLKCENTGSSAVKLTAKFQGIESKLDKDYVKVSDDGEHITYNGIETYDIVNNQVTVDPIVEDGATKNILYSIGAQNEITLNHFEIEDGYVIQKYGTTETHSGAINKRDNVTQSSNLTSIDTPILSDENIIVGTSYYYFSLTFLDDDDKDLYFMYQELHIDSLTMFETE